MIFHCYVSSPEGRSPCRGASAVVSPVSAKTEKSAAFDTRFPPASCGDEFSQLEFIERLGNLWGFMYP